MKRIDKINYYLDIAESVLERSTCIRRCFGAVIVKNDEIISTGYNGAPRGRKNCSDFGYCMREKLNIPRGERYELCRSVHGEENAIISASRKDMIGSSLYLVGKNFDNDEYVKDARPCAMCKRVIINSGIEKIYIRNDKEKYTEINVNDFITNDESLKGILGY
jgi:dCMP deaminase